MAIHQVVESSPSSPANNFGTISKNRLQGSTFESSSTSTPRALSDPSQPSLEQEDRELDFFSIANKYRTDKVAGHYYYQACWEKNKCLYNSTNAKCGPWGHYYDTIYQQRLGYLSKSSAEPFQFLEIGFFKGHGFQAYMEWLPNAEAHSMEMACTPNWKWGNFAANNKTLYEGLLAKNRLHCGDANNVTWLHQVWTQEMKRKDAPPLKVVVDDGAHLSHHMAQTVFFWFPKIEPGGFLVMEDIQPIPGPNKFRTQFLPQLMTDLHFCGISQYPDGGPCFPTIQPLLASIHCEMHICIFERNDKPSIELSLEESTMPRTALDMMSCPSLANGKSM